MKLLTTMKLVEVGDTKILAGHDADEGSVYVLRRVGQTKSYKLFLIPIAERDAALRAILSAEQSEVGELAKAVCETIKRKSKPKTKG